MERYSGLVNLEQELTQAASDPQLPASRRTLALELIEFISTAQSPTYTFAGDEYCPECIDPTTLRDIKIFTSAQSRWHEPRVWPTFRSGPTSSVPSVPESPVFEFEPEGF